MVNSYCHLLLISISVQPKYSNCLCFKEEALKSSWTKEEEHNRKLGCLEAEVQTLTENLSELRVELYDAQQNVGTLTHEKIELETGKKGLV